MCIINLYNTKKKTNIYNTVNYLLYKLQIYIIELDINLSFLVYYFGHVRNGDEYLVELRGSR